MLSYLTTVAVYITIFAIVAVGCNLILGFGGLCTIGHGAFYAIGAYTAAVMSTRLDTSFWLHLLVGPVLAAVVGMALVATLVTVNEDYFSLATFGFGIVIFTLLNNLRSLTGGSVGIPGIKPVELFRWQIMGGVGYLVLTLVIAVVCWLLIWLVIKSPFGRALIAMRDEPLAVVACGRSIARLKVAAFGLGSALAGVGGVLFAHYATYVDPTIFSSAASMLALAMVVVGGMGTLNGPPVGAILLVGFPELLRFLGLPQTTAGPLRQALYGLLLVVMLSLRPQGLLGKGKR